MRCRRCSTRGADDGERLLPALPLRLPRARRDARAADAAAPGRCCSCSAASRSRHGRRRWRSCRRSSSRPLLLGVIERTSRGVARRSRRSTASSSAAPCSRSRRRSLRGRSPLTLLGAYRAATTSSYSVGGDPPLPALARRRARPLPRRDPVRRAARAVARRRARCRPAARAFAAASLPVSRLADRRGRGVRLAAVGAADRGAEHVLPRAARADRAASRSGARVVPRRVGAARRGRAPSPASCRVTSRSPGSSARAPCPTRSRCCRGGGCRTTGSAATSCAARRSPSALVAAALFVAAAAPVRSLALPAARRRRTSSLTDVHRRATAATGSTSDVASARSGPASRCRTATGSTAPSGATPTSPSSGSATADAHTGLGERVLQPQRPHGLRPRRRRRRPTAARDGGARACDGGSLADAAGRVVAPSTCSPTATPTSTGKVVASDPAASSLYRVDGPLVLQTHVTGRLPHDTWSGRHVTYTRVRLHRRQALGRAAERPAAVLARPGRDRDGGRQVLGVARVPPIGERRRSPCRCARADARLPRRFTSAHAALAGRRSCRARPTRARSASHFLHFDFRPMRIAFDVSPLSHERTGVNNYIRGSLAGSPRRAAERGRRGRRVRADLARRASASIPEALAGHRRRAAARRRCPARTAGAPPGRCSATRRPSAGSARSTRSTSPTGCTRRSARGVRATTIHDLVPLHHPEWTTRRTRSMHGRKYRNAARTCDVIFANSAFTADDVAATLGFPRERVLVAHPGIGAEFTRRRRGGRPRRRRTLLTVATLEPRKNLGTLVEAFALLADTGLALVVVGGAGWGEQPQLDRPGHRAARPRHRRRARAPLPRRGGRRLPVAVRGLRHADHRGDGLAARPSSPPSHPSLDEACGDAAVRADPGEPEAIAAAIREALARRDELRALGLAHAAQLLVARDGRDLPRGVPSDSRSARHDAAPPDARRHGALPARAARPPRRRRSTRSRSRRRRALRHASPPTRSGTRGCGADGADVLHCPTFRGPFRVADAARRHRARPRGARGIPSGSTAGRRPTRASPCRASSPRRRG